MWYKCVIEVLIKSETGCDQDGFIKRSPPHIHLLYMRARCAVLTNLKFVFVVQKMKHKTVCGLENEVKTQFVTWRLVRFKRKHSAAAK